MRDIFDDVADSMKLAGVMPGGGALVNLADMLKAANRGTNPARKKPVPPRQSDAFGRDDCVGSRAASRR